MDRISRREDRLYRTGQPLGERLHRKLQCASARRAAQRRDLLHAARSSNRHRELEEALQRDPSSRIARLQTARTGGVHARIRRVAGFATSSGFAGHASATASLELTLRLDHSMWAAHLSSAMGRVLVSHCSFVAFSLRLSLAAAYWATA